MYSGQVEEVSECGLTYDVVMRLFNALLNQGYCLYTDNYYTSNALATIFLANSSHLTGTVCSTQTGFPDSLKNVKALQRAGNRGDIRHVNANDVVYVQWLEKRVVTVLSTQHQATTRDDTSWRVKKDGIWIEEPIRRPKAIADYNKFMGGVDAFDQLASTYRLLRRSKKSWKCMFYDLIEVATINSYLLMQEYKKEYPDAMLRPASYSQSEYRASLARQLAGIAAGEPPPLKLIGRKRRHQEIEDWQEEQHLPVAADARRNCALCNVERKSSIAYTVCKNRDGKQHIFVCGQIDSASKNITSDDSNTAMNIEQGSRS